jgi:hypothetical protein
MKDLHRTIVFNPAGSRADVPENGLLPGYGLQGDVISVTETRDYNSCTGFVVGRAGRGQKKFCGEWIGGRW